MLSGCRFTGLSIFSEHFSHWVAIQASRCAWEVHGIFLVKNPGVSLGPSYANGGLVVPPVTSTVLSQDVPEEKGNLFTRYPDLVRTMF